VCTKKGVGFADQWVLGEGVQYVRRRQLPETYCRATGRDKIDTRSAVYVLAWRDEGRAHTIARRITIGPFGERDGHLPRLLTEKTADRIGV